MSNAKFDFLRGLAMYGGDHADWSRIETGKKGYTMYQHVDLEFIYIGRGRGNEITFIHLPTGQTFSARHGCGDLMADWMHDTFISGQSYAEYMEATYPA